MREGALRQVFVVDAGGAEGLTAQVSISGNEAVGIELLRVGIIVRISVDLYGGEGDAAACGEGELVVEAEGLSEDSALTGHLWTRELVGTFSS
jgi:hypothetical protein